MNLLSFRLIFVLITLFSKVYSFTDYLLKDCDKDSFCHRNRYYAREQAKSLHKGVYTLDKQSIQITQDNVFTANLIKTVNDINIILPLRLYLLNDPLNAVRFTIDEIRHNCTEERVSCQRYNQTWNWVTLPQYHNTTLSSNGLQWEFSNRDSKHGWFSSAHGIDNEVIIIQNSNKSKDIKIELTVKDFQMMVYYKDTLQVVINERYLFNWEHYRHIDNNDQNVLAFESTFNMFTDDFQYSKSDTIPLGPESVGLDFTFVKYDNVYGIPEHADALKLRDTSSTNTILSRDKESSSPNNLKYLQRKTCDPYRLFNVDVFEYNVDSKQPMYGSIPLMIAARPGSSMGILWLNPSDTWVDINYHPVNNINDTKTHWISENGIIDVTLFFGDHPKDITNQYVQLTGSPVLPQLSAIGYHQCRWNYNNELDVLNVEKKMDDDHFPFDFIWLDLDYTDQKKYFTWNLDAFPKPTRLLKKLNKLGRQLVVLIDPHLMAKYDVTKKIVNSGSQVKNHLGRTFLGDCWPGKSIWIDTISKIGQVDWSNLFKDFINKWLPQVNIKWNNLHFWNDMNEPSIFSGPETTAPKDLLHDKDIEERSIHNLYGLSVHETTYKAVKEQYKNLTRPFILTRSFFVGSQRSAATWTGDNVADWDYLRISIPMILTNNIVGMPFIGADIAGFSGDPDPELIVRWYQAGLWYPFFRAHAHLDTKRREPYLFEETVKNIVRNAIQLRYKLLPTFYTAFHEASITGYPIMCPMFYEKSTFIEMYDIDNQFYLSDSGIIVKPIVSSNTRDTPIILAPGIYYDLESLKPIVVSGDNAQVININVPLSKIPAFIEGGHIITRKDRYRRSSQLMLQDPYTLVIAPNHNREASGKLYVDDGKSFQYEEGQYLKTNFKLSNGIIKNQPNHVPTSLEKIPTEFGNTLIETIIIPTSENSSINVGEQVKVKQNATEWYVDVTKKDNLILIQNPLVYIENEWEIIF